MVIQRSLSVGSPSPGAPTALSVKPQCSDDAGFTIKIPPVKRAGNPLQEQELKAQYELLAGMVEEMVADPSHITPLHGELRKRCKTKELQLAAEADSQFDRLPSIRSYPDDWLITMLIALSDKTITSDQLVKAKAFDDEALAQLLIYATQLTPQVKLPTAMLVKEVSRRMLLRLAKDRGDRLKNLAAQGAFKGDGSISWKKGCFELFFHKETKKLIKVTHLPTKTDADQLPADTHIDNTWIMDQNWSDLCAWIKKPPYPAVKLRALFSKDKGPNLTLAITSRTKEWIQMITEVHGQWEDDIRKTKEGNISDTKVREQLEKHASTKKEAQMVNLRDKAQQRLKAKKAKREVKLDA